MKKILSFILCAVALLLVGCSNNQNEFGVGPESDIKVSDDYVLMTIKENSLTSTGATLVLKNATGFDVTYGEPYEIEIKEDGKWHKINVELDFNLPAYFLEVGKSVELDINWEHGYGSLAKGEYRIIKSFSIENEDEKHESIYAAAQFTIE